MIRINMLPAKNGDAIYAEVESGGSHHSVLIDGGPARAYSAIRAQLMERRRELDLLIVTHIDTDHIDGCVTYLLDDIGMTFADIWFNGRAHLDDPLGPRPDDRYLGGVEGEILSAFLEAPELTWNDAFGGAAVVVPPSGPREIPLGAGAARLTLLSPTVERLTALRCDWDDAVLRSFQALELVPPSTKRDDVAAAIQRGGLDAVRGMLNDRQRKRLQPPGDWVIPGEPSSVDLGSDPSKANGASIVVLLETEDAAVLLGADGWHGVIEESVLSLIEHRGGSRLRLDAFKLSHHGSRNNLSPDLLALLDCDTFLISSDGSMGHNHPDDETIEMILDDARRFRYIPKLHFNYLSHRTEAWMDPDKGAGELYKVFHPPEEGEIGLTVEFPAQG